MNRCTSNRHFGLGMMLITLFAGIIAGGMTQEGQVLGESAMRGSPPPTMLPEVVVTAPRLES